MELTPAPKKQGTQRIKWCFTINNWTKKCLEQIERLKDECKLLVYQFEIGDEKETPHVQGFCCVKTKKRMTEMSKILTRARFAPMLKKSSVKANVRYCSKEDTRIEGTIPFFKGCKGYMPPREVKVLDPKVFYEWQKDLLWILSKEPDDRTIYWIKGGYGIGKSKFVKYLCMKEQALMIDGAERHILSQVGSSVKRGDDKDTYIYMCVKGQYDAPFKALEKIKDGHFTMAFGTKCNGEVFMNNPHVLVFSNEYPNEMNRHFHPDKTKILEIENNRFLNFKRDENTTDPNK